jgi:hypothetical protein
MPNQPETPSQAREFDKTRNHYSRLGLCNRCAAQAAYGHADGFSTVHAPCVACLPIVATLPTDELEQWRSQGRRLQRTPSAGVPLNGASAPI